ncbi:MAG: A/G-specific adenine glycosylase [Candidatus Thorarchaeota archaeon]
MYKKKNLSPEIIKIFQEIIYNYYKNNAREFPFRKNITPYNVLVSEVMLQQTQTGRVSEKFLNFTAKFSNFQELADASLEDVLKAWQGLGYNRRAIALKTISERIINEYNGKLPKDIEILQSFPQIGHNTASSIAAFAYNLPTIFIETNIRRVYIYFFFPGNYSVKDNEILKLVQKTMDFKNPREWYYSLMDYGVMLKKTHPELNKRSAHYKKQSKFEGSNRELRGRILKMLLKLQPLSEENIINKLKEKPDRTKNVLEILMKEGFIEKKGELYFIPS